MKIIVYWESFKNTFKFFLGTYIYTKTGIVIPHNADGTKTCAFSCSAGIAVTASVAVNGTNACTVSIDRKASSFTHTVKFSIGSYSYTASSVGTSTSYAIPLTWLNAIPNATTGTATVTVTTFSGSTQIGGAVSATFKITVPASIVPSISNLALSEAVSGISDKFLGYVQNKSKLAVKITASGVYSSTIKSYKTTILGLHYTAATFTSEILTGSGTVSVVTTVTDSRGRTATLTKTIDVIAYTLPSINVYSVFRANGLGTADYEGSGAADPNTTTEELILTSTNTPISGVLFFVKTMFYSSKSTPINRTQYAYPYNNATRSTYYRTFYSGAWSEWVEQPVIIEKGTSGIWTYRKYSDGTAECFGKIDVTGNDVNIALGGWYRGANLYEATTYPYPLTFTEAPVVEMMFQTRNASAALLWVFSQDATTAKSYLPQSYLIRPVTGTGLNGNINIIAKGKI